MPIKVALAERTKKIMFSFPPIAGTRGQKLLMEISVDPGGSRPFGLVWNKASEKSPRFVDYYPSGEPYFNGRPLAQDLSLILMGLVPNQVQSEAMGTRAE